VKLLFFEVAECLLLLLLLHLLQWLILAHRYYINAKTSEDEKNIFLLVLAVLISVLLILMFAGTGARTRRQGAG